MTSSVRKIPAPPLAARHNEPSALSKALNGESTIVDFSKDTVLDIVLLRKLCTALENNESVTHLNLSNNKFGDEGCELIGTLLAANSNIIAINMSGCGMTDLGACCILRCSRKFSKLQSINFSRNAIGDATMYEVDRLVHSTTCLSELVLTDTGVSFAAAVKLLETMLSNYTLLYCALPFSVGCSLLDEVKLILTRNWKRITKLDGKLSTLVSVKDCLKHEAAVMDSQWKTELADEETARTRAFAPSVADWQDASMQNSLMCLTVLDKKTKFQLTDKPSGDLPSERRSSARSSPRNSPRRSYSSTLAPSIGAR